MKKIIIVLMLLSVFGVYLYTLYPVPAPEDSGGYTAIAYLLDIAHAPGNPLYVMAGKIFTLVPLGNIAYRLNLLSAFFAILALLVIYRIVLMITGRNMAAFIASSFFAFTYEFWYTTTFAKTFTMSCFFVCLILYFMLKFMAESGKKYFYIACYCAGLGIGVHYFLMIFVPVLFLAGLLKRKDLKFIDWPAVIGLGLLGLSVYAYLPLRSSAHPLINFGQPDNFKRLMEVLLRKDWSIFKMSATAGSPLSFAETYGRMEWLLIALNNHLCTVGILISVIGFIVLWRRQKNIFLIIFSLVLLTGPVWLIFSAFPVIDPFKEAMNERFLPILECFLVIPIGVGLNELIVYLEKNTMKKAAWLFVLLFALPLSVHLKEVNKRYNFLAEDYASNFFRSMERGSAFFAGQHVNSVSMYYQYVKNRRNDVVRVIDTEMFIDLLRKCRGTNVPVYVDPSYNNYFSYHFKGDFKGLNIKLNPAVTADSWEEEKIPWELFCYRGDFTSGEYKDFYSQMVLMWYTEAIAGYGAECIKFKDTPDAIKAYMRCIAIGVLDDKFRLIRTYNYSKIKPESQSAYVGILEAYNSAGDSGAVERLAGSLLRVFPDSSDICQYLALVYLKSNKLELAKSYGEKAVMLEPEDITANLNLGVIYEKMGSYDSALSRYTKAMEINPKSETAYYNTGIIYYKEKNWKKVIENFSKVLEINPARVELRNYIEQARRESITGK